MLNFRGVFCLWQFVSIVYLWIASHQLTQFKRSDAGTVVRLPGCQTKQSRLDTWWMLGWMNGDVRINGLVISPTYKWGINWAEITHLHPGKLTWLAGKWDPLN